MRSIRCDTAERRTRDLLHARRTITLRLIARHWRKNPAIGIGAHAICRTFGEYAPPMIEDAPAHDVLFHECRPRIERVRGKPVAVPNTQLRKVEDLNTDEYEQEGCRNSNMFPEFPISHLPP